MDTESPFHRAHPLRWDSGKRNKCGPGLCKFKAFTGQKWRHSTKTDQWSGGIEPPYLLSAYSGWGRQRCPRLRQVGSRWVACRAGGAIRAAASKRWRERRGKATSTKTEEKNGLRRRWRHQHSIGGLCVCALVCRFRCRTWCTNPSFQWPAVSPCNVNCPKTGRPNRLNQTVSLCRDGCWCRPWCVCYGSVPDNERRQVWKWTCAEKLYCFDGHCWFCKKKFGPRLSLETGGQRSKASRCWRPWYPRK